MQFSAVFVAFVLAATSSFAAPTSETHFLNKRDAVCGQDFRALVTNDSCLPNSKVYILGPKGAPTVVESTHPPVRTILCVLSSDRLTRFLQVPANAQCDHTVELQLLDKVAKTSGLCEVLTALAAAVPAKTKAVMLDKAATDVSAISNLNFLDSKINNQVRPLATHLNQYTADR